MPHDALPVAWPEHIDLNDTVPYAFAVTFSSTSKSPARRALHTHPTGLLAMRLSGGRFGIEVQQGFLALPTHCAVWVPPGFPHNLVQTSGTQSVSIHVAPEVSVRMPDTAFRCAVNAMTREMIRHFALVYKTTEKSIHAKRIAGLILEEVLAAKRLPTHFAPVSHEKHLAQLFRRMNEPSFRRLNAEEMAAAVGLSAKTLSRLSVAETGLTFGVWKRHCIMLYAIELLSANKSVEETAALSGFQTTSAFIEAFAKLFGDTPGNYAKTHLQVTAEPTFLVDLMDHTERP